MPTLIAKKNFILPILGLSLFSIVTMVSIISYINITVFKEHIQKDIKEKRTYFLQTNKKKIKERVMSLTNTINYNQTQILKTLENKLKKRVSIANVIVKKTYEKYKNTHSKLEIIKLINDQLSNILFDKNTNYYFTFSYSDALIYSHPIKKLIGTKMASYVDINGNNLQKYYKKSLETHEITCAKVNFPKPNNLNKKILKMNCMSHFKALDFSVATGEYLDNVKTEIQSSVLDKLNYSNSKSNALNYLHVSKYNDSNINDKHAIVLINPFKKEYIGKRIDKNYKGPKGEKSFENVFNQIEDDSGKFIEYWFEKPDKKKISRKISYWYYQKDWQWLISTGFYLDDLEKDISNMENNIIEHTNKIIKSTILYIILLSFLLILIAIVISIKINQTIHTYTQELKRKDAILHQQSRMASLGQMLQNIAHQWRQPLTVITTYAAAIQIRKDHKIENENKDTHDLESIIETTMYLSNTIDDFQNFFSSSKDMSSFYVKEIVDKSISLLLSSYNQEEIEIIKDIVEIKISGFKNELIQVLLNLLKNAKDALDNNDKNSKKLIFVKAQSKNNQIIINVKDSAGGIKKENLDKIFDPYFTTKHKSQGTGIGLYMSTEIMKQHTNGKLVAKNTTFKYQSKAYTGAEFTITFDLK